MEAGGDGDVADGPPLQQKKLALGAWIISSAGVFRKPSIRFLILILATRHVAIYIPSISPSYRAYVLVLTFTVYAAYHMSRKPFSVVAVSWPSVFSPG